MSSGYTTLGRLNASRKRVCRRAAGVIAVLSLLWAGGPARVHAAIQEVSLRGALESHDQTEAATPSSEGPPAVANESSMHSDRFEQPDVTAKVPPNIVCDTADTKYVAIRSQADSFNLRCNGEFSVLDIPNVGEVFGPDCKTPKALENGSMKAVLDHNVDDAGALRTMSVSSFPPEDEQLCLVCAVEDDAVAAKAASEIPDGDKCSVLFTILGTNNKDHVPMFAVKPQEQKVSEQAPNSPEKTLGGPQGGEEEKGQEQQSMPSAKVLQVRSSQETTRRMQRRGGSAAQRAAPRHPQQLEGTEETTPQEGDDAAAEQADPSQSSAQEQDAKQSSKQDEQQQDNETQTQGQQGSTEEQDDQEMRTYDKSEDDKTGEDSDSAEKEAKNPSKSPLQCIDKELHLRVGPGESVSFKCGDHQQVTPEATDLVYEESKGKCGDTPAYISELMPAAEVTKVDDAIVVAVALGKSEEKTVCYRCVKQQQEQEKTNTTSPEEKTAAAADQSAECEVFITLMPASAAEDVHLASSTSSTRSFPSSFLLGTVMFLGSLLHLFQ